MRKFDIILLGQSKMKMAPEAAPEHGDLDDFIFQSASDKSVSER